MSFYLSVIIDCDSPGCSECFDDYGCEDRDDAEFSARLAGWKFDWDRTLCPTHAKPATHKERFARSCARSHELKARAGQQRIAL